VRRDGDATVTRSAAGVFGVTEVLAADTVGAVLREALASGPEAGPLSSPSLAATSSTALTEASMRINATRRRRPYRFMRIDLSRPYRPLATMRKSSDPHPSSISHRR